MPCCDKHGMTVLGFEISFWHFSLTFYTFFCGSVNVILTKSISRPRNSIFCKGTSTDLCKIIAKPRLCNRRINVSLAISRPFIVWLISNMSSRKIIILIWIRFRTAMWNFNNFLEIQGAGSRPKHRHKNS